ncbi:enoyl-CoA hydratase-related protein [Syntrophomonas wolfei]|jgi:enoyl-CoA hydratase|uniref:enoyl-CoA hydratase-related protein n=1 Tax=Syntrophomonas wolfei TaxID=863 RepID=UPI000773437B|nr:enoyl-CoA hydratase-related protein [Syntrophomonas wolfei]
MEFENLILKKEERIAHLVINRPKALNALNQDTLIEIKTAVEDVRDDQDIDVLIISGAGGKAFVAGADITFMMEISALEGREFGLLGQGVMRLIEAMEKPVIAAIDGFCLGGGCELAMACDFRICSEKSKFGQPEVGLGVTPGFGGTQRLPRIVGTGIAKQLLYTGDIINADEAMRVGLVNYIVPSEQLMGNVEKLAQKIALRGQKSVRFCKIAVNEGMQTDIDRAMTVEADLFGLCFATEDQKEGMRAFVEKRKANFIGK